MGNIPFNCSATNIQRIFKKYKRILDVYIPTLPGLQKPHGYASVRFRYEQDAKATMDVLNEQCINGRVVSMRWAKVRAHQPSRIQASIPARVQMKSHPNTSYAAVRSKEPTHLSNRIEEEPDLTTIADPDAMSTQLQELQLDLVGRADGAYISILKLYKAIRDSRFASSSINITRISLEKFLITLNSKE
ncbi:serine/arginine-rich SC35-like splicing factor SCL28 [Magnolia sinica]|uniref:serine/arginine-rich SC35-like splicing factor SCL28 n=1 Tax=Magnolia sinica TaxID=86752 RepID=UPI0026583C55|nr:serine/arginine-rich SC35-like splicing factor SCL28 [Magnolia sinica]